MCECVSRSNKEVVSYISVHAERRMGKRCSAIDKKLSDASHGMTNRLDNDNNDEFGDGIAK